MSTKPLILFVEDEAEPAEMLASFLEMKGYDVLLASDGVKAKQLIRQYGTKLSLAILDIMIPDPNGIELCRIIRSKPETSALPVIFLTARDEEQDEIMGLSIGADDYIPKPAGLNLILAHIETLLRRGQNQATSPIKFGDILLDELRMEVYHNSKQLDLTASEYKILALLFRNPNRVYNRQEILEHISSDDKIVFDRTVDVHMKNLRLKMGGQGALIQTARGLGYRLNREFAK